MIKINPPLSFSEIGKRDSNQDTTYSKWDINLGEGLFLVCDGMGGTEGGEIASSLTCEVIGQYFKDYVKPNQDIFIIEQHIFKAVEKVHDKLEMIILENPHLNKMGTTLSLLYIHNQGVTIAHMGDSRVYHIQDASFWHTEDHSIVYELYKTGIIEKSKMATHEDKNIITKVIRGLFEPDTPEIKHIKKIGSGDCFLLMSDGVLEGLDERSLISIVTDKNTNDEDKFNLIKQACANESRDNYSLIFIKPIET
jgi:PPM family protein phosphatase